MDRYELRRLDYSLTDDHQALQSAYRDFFKTHCPIETVRAAEESGFDKSLWERLCGMGATTMALPHTVGGDDATLVDLTLVAEEIGRSLAPVPWIDHVCAARLLARLGSAESDVVNGKQLASHATTVSLPAVAGASELGAAAGGSSGFLAGDLDEIAVYPLALARAHVAAHDAAAIEIGGVGADLGLGE